jgi:hypothetical protein
MEIVPPVAISVGILLAERTHLSPVDLAAGGNRGVGHGGVSGPSFVPVGTYL